MGNLDQNHILQFRFVPLKDPVNCRSHTSTQVNLVGRDLGLQYPRFQEVRRVLCKYRNIKVILKNFNCYNNLVPTRPARICKPNLTSTCTSATIVECASTLSTARGFSFTLTHAMAGAHGCWWHSQCFKVPNRPAIDGGMLLSGRWRDALWR